VERIFKVISKDANRLDKILSKELEISRSQIEKLIKSGLVRVDGKEVVKPSFKIKPNQIIEYKIVEAPKKEPKEIDIDIKKLYEDDEVLVVNKPAGLVVHPAPSVKEPTLVDWLKKEGIRLSTISGEERHGIVHRLDKDTSGAILIAKDNNTHQELSKQLQDRSMGRYYLALINYPLKENIIVEKAIGRNPKNRLKMAIRDDGREAKSAFYKIATSKHNEELIAAKLFSGRTHQIRVHLGSLGRYILGDKLYGKDDGFKGRMMLHANLLYFIHPKSGKRVEVIAPLFKDMRDILESRFEKGKEYAQFKSEDFKSFFSASSFE